MSLKNGSVPFGCGTITIGGVAFVAENLSETTPVDVLERRNGVNVPSGWVAQTGFPTGSVTLQRPATSTALPTMGAEMTIPTELSTVSGTPYVMEVGATFEQFGITKFPITFRRAVA